MTKDGLPVPPGFTVSTVAHTLFLKDSGINARIAAILGNHDLHDAEVLIDVHARIAEEFRDTVVPESVVADIVRSYDTLSNQFGTSPLSVAVRSSATAEDTAESSFAGEYETFVGIVGATNVIEHVKLCWASAFTSHAITYAIDNKMSPLDVSMAVVIQKTVKARAAGVMFTLSPSTGDRSKIVIEASWGVGLSVVGGEVSPDWFAVDKISLNLSGKKLGDKRIEYIDGPVSTPVDQERLEKFCLSDSEAVAIAKLGKALEKLHGAPQDIEFALDREMPDGENIVLLQCRPETVWSHKHSSAPTKESMPLMDQITKNVFGLGKGSTSTSNPAALLPEGHSHD
jgi:pyruvate,water dikinase